MNITTRINLIFLVFAAFLIGVVQFYFLQQEKLLKEQYAQSIISDKQHIWKNIIDQEIIDHDNKISVLSKLLIPVLEINDTDDKLHKLNEFLATHKEIVDFDNDNYLFELYNTRELTLEYSASKSTNPKSPITSKIVEDVIEKKSILHGLGYDENRQLFLVSVFNIVNDKDKLLGVAIYGTKIKGLLNKFSNITENKTFIINRNSGLIEGEDRDFWQKLLDKYDFDTKNQVNELEIGQEIYSVAVFNIENLFNNQQAYLVSFNNISNIKARINRISDVFLFIFISFALMASFVVWYILKRAFRPLEESAVMIQKLVEGDASHNIATDRDDEIGKLLQSIANLRDHLIELWIVRRSRTRQRRRTEKIIKEEIFKLTDVLDEQDKNELNSHFQKLTQMQTAGSDENKSAELGSLALTLQKLGASLINKQDKLNVVIAELKEALATQTRFFAIQKELDIARKVQLSYVPPQYFEHKNLQLQALLKPSKAVGGDFYDYFMIDEHRLGFLVGDVSDKGVPSALFMMVSKTVLQVFAKNCASAAETVQKSNNLLASNNQDNFFVTLFFAIFDFRTMTMQYCNAGHNPPAIMRNHGQEIEFLKPTGDLVTAIMPDIEYSQIEVQLNPGDCLFLFTDGVTEAFNKNEELFGEQRILDLLNETDYKLPVGEKMQKMVQAVDKFVDGWDQSDDITAMFIDILETPKGFDNAPISK